MAKGKEKLKNRQTTQTETKEVFDRCCYKRCQSKFVYLGDARVEIRANMRIIRDGKILKKNLLVKWKQDGEAIFHRSCWDSISIEAKSRSTKITQNLSVAEKRAIKGACETTEYHDSDATVKAIAKQVAHLLKISKHAVFFTGAGISTSAGIGDYRGKSGKWSGLNGNFEESSDEEEGVPYEELRPTYTHEAICKLTESEISKYVISQNCDGLHRLSGLDCEKLSELHGNVYLEYCVDCNKEYERPFYTPDDDWDEDNFKDWPKDGPEKCDTCGLNHFTKRRCTCGGKLSDTIINFGDLLNERILERANIHSAKADILISLGSSMIVTPAADLIKKASNIIVCNRQETDFDDIAKFRVFADTDRFTRCLMKYLYEPEELDSWEAQILQKMEEYDKKREY